MKKNIANDRNRTERVFEILKLSLKRHELYTINDLVDETGADRASIYRDLDMLERVGFFRAEDSPLTDGRKKSVKFLNPPLDIPIGFTSEELTVIYLARGLFTYFSGTTLEKASKSMAKKLERFFDKKTVEKLQNALVVKTGPVRNYKDHSDKIDIVLDAILKSRKLLIEYRSLSGEVSRYKIQPYTLLFSSNALFLVCYSEKSNGLRNLAIERLLEVSVCNENFIPEFQEEIAEQIEKNFGVFSGKEYNITLKIKKEAQRRIKDKKIHFSQSIKFTNSGAILNLKISGKEDLFKWLATQGDDIIIIEPLDIVNEYKKYINKILDAYKDLN